MHLSFLRLEDEKLLKAAKKLPWEDRLTHKNRKVRNDANITDPKDSRLREFGELSVLLLAAQALGLPFLGPYLQSIGSDYRHGANFATLASTVLLPKTSLFVTGVSPFSLAIQAIQLNQMKQFKSKVDESHTNRSSKLPPPDVFVFGKSVYTFYIGQNDFTGNLASLGIEGVKQYLPQVDAQIAGTIKETSVLRSKLLEQSNLVRYLDKLKMEFLETSSSSSIPPPADPSSLFSKQGTSN